MKPNELEKLPLGLQEIYLQMSDNIMNDIIRRIKKAKGITSTADYLINRQLFLGGSMDFVRNEIKKALKLSDREVDSMFSEVLQKDYVESKSIYELADKDFIKYEDNFVLQQQINAITVQSKGELINISKSLGFALKGQDGRVFMQSIASYYQTNVDKAILDMVAGTVSYDDVIKRTVKEMTNSGIRSIDYEGGIHNRIEVAARRAIMTGSTQIAGIINEFNMELLNTNYVEVEWHSGARNTGVGYLNHANWQGKVYTMEQLISICGYGQGGGIGGWNCRHSFSPFVKGLSEKTFSSKQLKNKMIEENSKKWYNNKGYNSYEATQKQRAIETELRRRRSIISQLKTGGIDENLIASERIKYRTLTKEYKDFSKAMGLQEQKARIYVDNLGRA